MNSIPVNYATEIFRAALTAFDSLVTLALAWFIGNRISIRWAIRQKRRELNLGTLTEFYRLYGEFFAIWKTWNYFKKGGVGLEGGEFFPEDTRWTLLNRACAAEAGMEAIFVRLCSERHLGPEEVAALGRFRQAYHRLREHIREDQALVWNSSHHPEYLAFKQLACRVANLLGRQDADEPPTAAKSCANLVTITDNKWDSMWVTGASEPEQAAKDRTF